MEQGNCLCSKSLKGYPAKVNINVFMHLINLYGTPFLTDLWKLNVFLQNTIKVHIGMWYKGVTQQCLIGKQMCGQNVLIIIR